MDCEIIKCHNYDKDCFFKTILVKKPDPKTGCSYFRKMGKTNKFESDENENELIQVKKPKKEKVPAKKGKKKKEDNSLKELL